MFYLLHGDDTAYSRKKITELIGVLKTSHLDGAKLDTATLEVSLASESLFSEKEALMIEYFFSKNKKKKEIIDFLNKYSFQKTIIFWENKKIIKTSFQKLKNLEVLEFSLPQVYFDFLDNFTPQKVSNVYQMYHLLLLTTEPTQIFYSLIKRLRALLIIQSGGRSLEIERLSPWQLSKLRNQVRFWPKEKLVNFYKKLQDTEIKLKSGGLPLGLSKHLDILILSDLT